MSAPARHGRAGRLTRFTHKNLLGGAGGTLAHGVVHAHADLVAPVLAQVWGREKGRDERGPTTPGGPLAEEEEGVPGEQQERTEASPGHRARGFTPKRGQAEGGDTGGWQRGWGEGTRSGDLLSSSYWVRDTSLRLCTA